MDPKPTCEALETRIRELEQLLSGKTEAEAQLKIALAELSAIHEAAPVAMMIVDRDRRVQKVNEFAGIYADRPAAEMIGMRGGEALRCLHHLANPRGCGFEPYCDTCGVREAVLETFASGKGRHNEEVRLPLSHGGMPEERWLQVSTALLKSDGADRVLVCVQDITERRRAEERTALMARMLDEAPTYISIHDTEGRFLFANRSAHESHGYTREEFMSRSIHELCVPESQARIEARLRRIREKGEARFELDHFRKDGSLLPLEVHSREIDWHGQKAYLAICTDLTERRQTEQRDRLRVEMLDAAPSSITVHDFTGRFLYSNRKAFEIHRYTREEFMQRNLRDLDLPESAALIGDRNKLIAEKGETAFEVQHRRKDGSVIPMHVYVKKVEWEGVPAILSIATDITGQKRDELIKNALIEKLEKTLAEVKTLHGIIPICAVCKQVRNDDGYWSQVEAYISKHSGAVFSHGLCPECYKSELRKNGVEDEPDPPAL